MTLDEELALIAQNKTPSAAPAPAPAASAPVPPRSMIVDEQLPPPEEDLPVPPAMDAGVMDVAGAAWEKDTINTDAWWNREGRRRAMTADIFAALDPEAAERVRRNLIGAELDWNRFRDQVMFEISRNVPRDPARFGQFPLTPDEMEKRIDAELGRELAEAQAILDQPGGGVAEFVGSAGRAVTDQRTLALLPFGVSGAAWRTIVSEAALGAVGEAITLPSQYDMAERLGTPDPDPWTQIFMGTAVSGGLTAGVVGAARVIGKLRARHQAKADAAVLGGNPMRAEVEIDAAEDTMRGQGTVQEAIAPRPLPLDPTVGYNEGATLRAIIGAESGGNATAQNPRSSARGVGQFIAGTWLDMIRRHRPDLVQGRTANELLALRDDPQLNAEMTQMYARENHARLKAEGLPAGPGEIYLSHFMGPGGAVRALKAPLDTPITSLMSPKEIEANRGIRFGGKSFADFTAGDLRRWSQHKMRSAYDPNASTDVPVFTGEGRGSTGRGQVTAGDGQRIDIEYEVVDFTRPQRASGDLQPRDRSRITSDVWIADTASRLDAAKLMPQPDASTGPPIIGPDDIIESGNGRFAAIGRAYERFPDRAADYRRAIEAEGFVIPEGIERPVLVARRKTPLDDAARRQFVIDAQDSGVAVMSATDQARMASRAMTGPVLGRFNPAEPINGLGNADFVRAALARLPRAVRNALFDGQGVLNREGQRRLREALFARAWPDKDLLEAFAEGDPGDLKSLLEALDRAAPAWAALRADIEAGTVRADLDVSGHVIDAMRFVAEARALSRKEGLSIADALRDVLAQPDMIEGPVAPLTVAMIRKLWRDGRAAPADDVAGFLTRYADEARRAGGTDTMFPGPDARAILTAIDAKTFGDLPADIGAARGRPVPPPPEPVALPPVAQPEGASSPAAIAADTEMLGDMTRAADPEADAAAASLFDAKAELADLTIEMPDGGTWTAAEVLKDIEADLNFSAFLKVCAIAPGGTA